MIKTDINQEIKRFRENGISLPWHNKKSVAILKESMSKYLMDCWQLGSELHDDIPGACRYYYDNENNVILVFTDVYSEGFFDYHDDQYFDDMPDECIAIEVFRTTEEFEDSKFWEDIQMLMFNNLEDSFLQKGILYREFLFLEEMQIVTYAKLLPSEIE